MTVWRVVDIIKSSSDFLEKKGVPDARLDAETLLGDILKKIAWNCICILTDLSIRLNWIPTESISEGGGPGNRCSTFSVKPASCI